MDSSHLKTIKNIMTDDRGRRFTLSELSEKTKFTSYIIRECLGFFMDEGKVLREARKYYWRVNDLEE